MALAITSFTPTTGPTSGGTRVVITGTQLDTADDVLFGTIPAEIDTTATNTATSLTVIAPAIPNSGTLVVKIGVIDNDAPAAAYSATNYTYTAVTSPVLATVAASKWKFEIDTSVGQDGSNYVPVRGVTNFTPAVTQTTQDDSDYDSGHWGSEVVTQLKWNLACEVDRKVAAGYVEDPGQKALRVASVGVTSAAVVRVRWYDRNGGLEAYEGYGNVSWTDKGGTTADKSSATVNVMGRGTRANIANPAA